jgi:hypothetical protein
MNNQPAKTSARWVRGGGGTILGLAALLTVAYPPSLGAASPAVAKSSDIELTDPQAQAEQFIRYYHTITLTATQQEIKRQALETLPAPCCRDYPALTCCCQCNVSKSVWGLSHYLIAKKGYDAVQVRATVERWLRFVNPSGFSGDACYTGGCGRAFDKNGCGGMTEAHVVARSGQ